MNGDIDPRTSLAIDEALRGIGGAVPPSGMEGRILTRVASRRIALESAAHPLLLPRLQRFSISAVGLLSACLVAAVIVTGSVHHSRRLRPGQIAPPVLQLPGHGIGAASAVHPAAPAAAPVPAGEAGRSGRRSARGRARITLHSRKAPGVAVPNPDAAPQN